MHDARRVDGLQPCEHLHHDGQRLRGRHAARPRQAFAERLALQELHREEGQPSRATRGRLVVNAELEDAADVVVRYFAGQLHLGLQTDEHALVVESREHDRLEGHHLVEQSVACLVHLAHAPSGHQANDLVAFDHAFTGREGAHLPRRSGPVGRDGGIRRSGESRNDSSTLGTRIEVSLRARQRLRRQAPGSERDHLVFAQARRIGGIRSGRFHGGEAPLRSGRSLVSKIDRVT